MSISTQDTSAASPYGVRPAHPGALPRTTGSVTGRPSGRSAMTWIQGMAREASVLAYEPWARVFSGFREPTPTSRTLPCRLVFPGAPAPAADREPPRPPVLLVHGLGGSTAGWLPLARALRAAGLTVGAISYGPFRTSLERLAEELADAVQSLQAETGSDRVHLVGHSLGGVVIAQAFADGLLTDRVASVVTIAAPFGGSPWASLLPVGTVVRALRQGSPQLGRLARSHAPGDVRWLAVTGGADMIVPGRRALPAHAEFETVEVHGVGHLGLLQNPQVISQVISQVTDAVVGGPVTDLAAA
jgi:triacylglycerol lipase